MKTPNCLIDSIEGLSRTSMVASFGEDEFCLKTENEETILHLCTDPFLARMLLKSGISINSRDLWGQTPLHCCRNMGMAVFLIENGADIEAKDYLGNTPLETIPIYAEDRKNIEEYLLEQLKERKQGKKK